jgi:hypothetical protein
MLNAMFCLAATTSDKTQETTLSVMVGQQTKSAT